MHSPAFLTAFAALVVSLGQVVAIPEAGLEHRVAELESRAQCLNSLHVVGTSCANQGHTACSANRGSVVSERSPWL